MATLEQFEAFGKQLVELDVSANDLETRINGLGHKIEDKEIKAMVTGFVDRLLEKEFHEKESYELVHGFARFLYNGDFKDVRKRVLDNIAKRSAKIAADERYDIELLRWLKEKQDTDALATIAESMLNTNPAVTYTWHPGGENRPAILRKIVQTHQTNKKWREVVASCLHELEDKDGTRALAKEYLDKDIAFAWKLLEKHGTSDDWMLAANAWKNKDIGSAYHASVKARDAYPHPQEAEQLRDQLKERFIREQPAKAFEIFNKRERYEQDKKALLLIAKLFLEKGKLEDALVTFSAAEYNGPEVNNIGLTMLKRLEKDKKPSRQTYKPFERAMREVALSYFENGGKVEIAAQYIYERAHDDDLRRKLGYAFAKLPPKKGSNHAAQAYIRLIQLERKNPQDERLLDQLRERMVADESSHHTSTFIGYHDQKGLQLVLAKRKDLHDQTVYDIARALNDAQLLEKTRRAIVAEGARHALDMFEREKDDVGIRYAREHIGHGVDLTLVDKILPRERR